MKPTSPSPLDRWAVAATFLADRFDVPLIAEAEAAPAPDQPCQPGAVHDDADDFHREPTGTGTTR